MNLRLKTAIFFLLLNKSYVTNASMIPEHKDFIDIKYSKCLENPQTTADMTNCAHQAYDDWGKALNDAYQQLISIRQFKNKIKVNQAKIVQAQKEWIKFRDAEFLLIDEVFSHIEGTMYIPIRVNYRVEVIKKRVQELRKYLSLTEEFSF